MLVLIPLDCFAVDGYTCQIHAVTRLGIDGEVVVLGSLAVLRLDSEDDRFAQFGRLNRYLLSCVSGDIRYIRHLRLNTFHTVSRQRQGNGIRLYSRVKSVDEHAIQHDSSQRSVVALRSQDADTVGSGSNTVFRRNGDGIFNAFRDAFVFIHDSLRGDNMLFVFRCNGLQEQRRVGINLIRIIAELRHEVVVVRFIHQNLCQFGVIRKRRRIGPSIGLACTRHSPCHLCLGLDEDHGVCILLTDE